MFGNPETTPGGLALKFYASVRIDVRRIENLKKGDEVIGTRVRAKVTKNKVAPPYRQAEFTLILGKGISREACIIDKGVEAGFIEKSGSWFIYGDEKLGQGAENARQYLKDNPELADEIEDKLYVKYLGHHYDGKKAAEAEQAEEKPAKKTSRK
jgi:recombination protein RecA